jgi:hypothetical protein
MLWGRGLCQSASSALLAHADLGDAYEMSESASRTVVFILATNYSGSHLLAELLGAHSQCLSIGELHNLEKLAARSRTDRNVVADYAENPLFTGLAGTNHRDWHARIFANAATLRPSVTTLIDNSKRPQWARHVARSSAFRPALVHLLRDPRAVVRRWLATYTTPAARAAQRRRLARRRPQWLVPLLQAPFEVVCALKWVDANRRIAAYCRRSHALVTTVDYETLARKPAETLERLMPALGLAYEPLQLDYGRASHAGTRKRDWLDASRESIVALDERWREELSQNVIESIETLPQLRACLAAANLELTPEGLRPLDAGVRASPSS